MKLHEILNEENVGKKFKDDYYNWVYEIEKDEEAPIYYLKRKNGYHAYTYWLVMANYEEVIEKDTGWSKEDLNHGSYWTYKHDTAYKTNDWNDLEDKELYLIAKKFTNIDKAKEIHFKETLWRKLQRFADENNNEIDWNALPGRKYFIYYDYYEDKISIDETGAFEHFGQVYFSSREIAERALEEFKEELEKYFKK